MGQLARSAKDVPVWICYGDGADAERLKAWEGLGAQLLHCGSHGLQLDPADVLTQLGKAGLTRIFCEGGSALAASLLAADLVDELVGFTAGLVIGADGLPSLGALGVETLKQAPRFDLIETRTVGGDLMHRWRRSLA